MSMEEEKDNYMHKQQELIDALTDEVQELYRSQEATEKKLDGIALLNSDPEKVKKISNHLNSCPRKDELEALSISIKSWTEKINNITKEVKEFKEVVENDNLIITVKDNILQKLYDSFSELQWQIDELKKTKTIDNSGNVSLITPE